MIGQSALAHDSDDFGRIGRDAEALDDMVEAMELEGLISDLELEVRRFEHDGRDSDDPEMLDRQASIASCFRRLIDLQTKRS